ncbi:hypothetical protein [Halobacillus trueperi]|nr:hypothetical protein [Halobacillus trueperi]
MRGEKYLQAIIETENHNKTAEHKMRMFALESKYKEIQRTLESVRKEAQ